MSVDLSNPTTLKQAQRILWSLGDYREVARMLEPDAEALADACGPLAGMRVADVAAGSGNFAVVAMRRGAAVIATDFSPQMVAWGQGRCQTEGLQVEWREADAEDLPFEDGAFDCCVSMFGAMFAPRPTIVAGELFRVTRAGGLVAMTNWTQDGFCGRLAALISRYGRPAPPGLPSPFDWGDPEIVRALFGGRAASLAMELHSATFTFDSIADGRAFFEQHNAPMVAIRALLPPERYAALAEELAELLWEFNRGDSNRVTVEAEYLTVLARKAA